MNNSYDTQKLELVYTTVTNFHKEQETYKRSNRIFPIRLGQYLMNLLEPNSVNTEIFYETKDSKALVKFIETYCINLQE